LVEQAFSPNDRRTELSATFATLEEFGVQLPGALVEGDVLASDGSLADALGAGDVGSEREGAVNITRVTPSQRAPLGRNHPWRLNAYARMPPHRLAEPVSIAEFLALHEPPNPLETVARVSRLGALNVLHERSHRLDGGRLSWGDTFTLEAPASALNAGELWLIGSFLHRALAERSESLRFSRLKLRREGSDFADYGERMGQRLPFPLG
jgi:hypothetical protein